MIEAGVAQLITGVIRDTGTTLIATVLVAVVYNTVLVGVNVTDNCCALPKGKTVPDGGVYTNVPATGLPLFVAVALSCVALKAVPT